MPIRLYSVINLIWIFIIVQISFILFVFFIDSWISGNQVKNVQIRLKDDNSYELVSSSAIDSAKTSSEGFPSTDESLNLLNESGLRNPENEDESNNDITDLEKFEKRELKMKELNKRRKEVLTKAIAERFGLLFATFWLIYY